MSFATIAATAITFIAPFLKKGGESFIGEGAKDLWKLIKKPFEKKESQKETIKQLEENPDDLLIQGKVIGKLEEHLEDDPEYAKELEELLKKVGAQQNNNTNIQNITGDGNISMQGSQNSQININK